MNRTRTALLSAAAFVLMCVLLALVWWRWFREVESPVAPSTSSPAEAEQGGAASPGPDDAGHAKVAQPELPGVPGPPSGFKAGKWRVTVEVKNKPAPGQPKGPFVDEQCLQGDDPGVRGHVPPGCRHFEYRTDGSHFLWRIRCMGARMGDGMGQADLAPDGQSMSGTLRVWLPNPITTAPQRHDQTFSARRVGDCD